jgi:hypothetical protein
MPPGPSWLGVERIHQSSLAVLMGLAAMVIGVAKVLAPAVRRRHVVWTLVTVVVVAPLLLLGAASIHPPLNVFCDGPYPAWTGDPCSDSWTNPSLLDYVWPPERWVAPLRGRSLSELGR